MSQSVREKLVALEADVEQLRLSPAAEVRRRGRRRGRQRIVVTALSAVLVAAGVGVAGTHLTRDQGSSTAAADSPGRRCAVPVDVQLPDGPSAVAVRVFNGTGQAGRGQTVTQSLLERQFTQARSGGDLSVTLGNEVGVLRYGPSALGAAEFLRAYVHGRALMQFDPARGDDTVDLVLGPGFQRLATTTEVNSALVEAGPPAAPPGCR